MACVLYNEGPRGHEVEEVKKRYYDILSGKFLIVLYEVDFLDDYDIL